MRAHPFKTCEKTSSKRVVPTFIIVPHSRTHSCASYRRPTQLCMCQKPATMWKTTPVQPHFAALLGLVFLVLWCCSTSVEAHGQLQVPPSRNHLINNVWTAPPGIAYNQNSGNGR